jgi:hypothetical protein
MNENPPPLSPEHVDELLSAELDGEFDAAAIDLGLDPDRATELLAATDGVDARRRQLEAARGVLGEVPPLDELTATRLRTAAVAAASVSVDDPARVRRRRAWTGVAGIAAVLVAVLGIATVANRNSSNPAEVATAGESNSNASRSAGPTTAPPLPSGAQNFGAAADAAALGDRIRKTLHAADATAPERAAAPNGLTTTNGSTDFALSSDAAQAKRAIAYSDACDLAARRSVDAAFAPVLSGTATLGGTPVTVFVYRRGSAYVLVASDAGCNVVARRVLER